MKHKEGYFVITIAWIGGALVGAGLGFLAVRNFKGKPKSGFDNLALFFILIIVVALAAIVMGFICSIVALLVGGYAYALRTILIMLPLIVGVLLLVLAFWLPVFLLPFVPAFARFIALHTIPKVPLSVSPSPAPPTN